MRTVLANARPRGIDREETDALRLFHGVSEGWPGLTVDSYGDRVLVQTFREPQVDLAAIEAWAQKPVVWRHRGRERHETPVPSWAVEPTAFHELGVRYRAPLVHRGMDPWLFLDFRAGRRWIARNAAGRRVLNTFSYTCGAGLVAAVHGAEQVVNLDHGGWALEAGRGWAEDNGVEMELVREDFYAATRQWAGGRLGGRGRRFARRPERRFDLVVLDPPTRTKGPLGAVDIVGDYASLAKPCIGCLDEGGVLLATNHSARVSMEVWVEQVTRCAAKAGRPVQRVEVVVPDEDFPSFDGAHPLSMAAFYL